MTTAGQIGENAGSRHANVARSAARLTAVQALYQLAMSGGTVERTIAQFTAGDARSRSDEDEGPIAEADKGFFAELVRGTHARQAQLEEMLTAALDESWPAERMEFLLKAILQCGAYELLAQPAVPARVVISEYVRVADAFFEGKEPALVNAVLDRIARLLRAEELAETDGRR